MQQRHSRATLRRDGQNIGSSEVVNVRKFSHAAQKTKLRVAPSDADLPVVLKRNVAEADDEGGDLGIEHG
jgi:hypothetical protein